MLEQKKLLLMSIRSYYARQIFEETKCYEFRKSPLKKSALNEKIYIYSAKDDKAIIGYVKVDEIIKGNTKEILHRTGYEGRSDAHEIVDYYGKFNPNCYALHLYDVTEFDKYLNMDILKRIKPGIKMPQYYAYVTETDPLYDILVNWDKTYALDGENHQPEKIVKELIRERIHRK